MANFLKMTSAGQLYSFLTERITSYPPKEKQAISYMLLKHYMRLRNVDVMVDRPISSSAVQPDWDEIVSRLNKNEPVQHIIGSEEFCGLTFNVSSSVLIPRPETEDLVRLITRDYAEPEENVTIVDIGTGSGCIAIVLARFIPHATLVGWDVSEDALDVARDNATQLMADVRFEIRDILQTKFPMPGLAEKFDCVVSNPPYVTYAEAENMEANVLRFEPHQALFVEDDDPIIFYLAIARFGKYHLKSGGRCYVEINPHFDEAVKKVFLDGGFEKIDVLQDIHGKNRFIRSVKK